MDSGERKWRGSGRGNEFSQMLSSNTDTQVEKINNLHRLNNCKWFCCQACKSSFIFRVSTHMTVVCCLLSAGGEKYCFSFLITKFNVEAYLWLWLVWERRLLDAPFVQVASTIPSFDIPGLPHDFIFLIAILPIPTLSVSITFLFPAVTMAKVKSKC